MFDLESILANLSPQPQNNVQPVSALQAYGQNQGIQPAQPNTGFAGALQNLGRQINSYIPGTNLPSDIQSYNFFSRLTPEQQAQFLTVKRASQIMDLGGQQTVYNPLNPLNPTATFDKTLKPEDQPVNAQAKSEAQATGEQRGQQTGAAEKKAAQAVSTLSLVNEAKKLLPVATSGTMENILTTGKGLIGKSDATTQADSRLETIGAALVANVPRMEGPQSDKDVALYQKAAGDVANRNKAAGDRLAALNTIEELQMKYATQPTGNNPVPSDGLTADPSVFNGVNPSNPPNLPTSATKDSDAKGWSIKRIK